MNDHEFDENLETDNGNSPETINIGETFRLFVPNKTTTEISNGDYGYKGFPIFESKVMLDTKGLLPKLPITASAYPSYKNKSQAFAPFSPEDGYQVTTEDFGKETRINKKVDIIRDNGDDIISSPLSLSVHIERPDSERDDKLTPEDLSLLKRLRFQVFFPNGLRFEARGKNTQENGDTSFAYAFYPVDTGPLVPVPILNYEGLQIALPADLEKLQHIEGMFLLAPPQM